MSKKITLIIAVLLTAVISTGGQCLGTHRDPVSSQRQGTLEPLTFLSVKGNKIINEKGREIKLRGFHYDCFYVFRKKVYDAIKGKNGDPDQINIEIAKHYFREYDIREIKDMEANVVRIGFRLWEIEKEPYSYSEKALNHLDNTIERWGKNGIYVILDLHAAGQNSLNHNKEYGNIIWRDKDFQNRVVSLWGVIAKRHKNNPYVVGFDIINEPQAPTKKALYKFYQKIIKKIRETDKKHILFIERNLFDSENILFGGTYDDANIVYSVHFYKPAKFTGQGQRGKTVGYKYPAKYGGVFWNKNQINKYFVDILAQINNKPLFVGEFSSAVWSGGEYALQWVKDVIEVFNSEGIHYTFFSYKFPMRQTRSFYMPREVVYEHMRRLQKEMTGTRFGLSDLTEEKKRLFHTEDFESFTELRKILKAGFGSH